MANPLHSYGTASGVTTDITSQVNLLSSANSSGVDRYVVLDINITGLDSGGGDLTFVLSIGSDGPDVAVTRQAATTFGIVTDPILWPDGDTLILKCTSDNSSDTSVSWSVEAIDIAPLQPETEGRALKVESDGHAHADLKEWLGSVPAVLADTDKVPSSTQHMVNDVITAAAAASDFGAEIAALVETYIVNEGDATAVMQAIADLIAQDWIAGDASPLAIIAALKADAEWSNLATIAEAITTINGIVDDILVDTDELQTDWVNGGRLDNLLDTAAAGGGGGAGDTIIAVSTTVSTGAVSTSPITAYYLEGKTLTFAVVDSDGTAISLAGDTIKFVVEAETSAGNYIDIFVDTGSVGGDDNNEVTVTIAGSDNDELGDFIYSLRNETDDNQVLARGLYNVVYAALEDA